MKNKFISVIVACVLCAALIMPLEAVPVSAAVGDNLISNGGFETLEGGAPTGFTAYQGWGSSYSKLVSTGAYEGNNAVQLASGNNGSYFDVTVGNVFYGTTYTLSFMYKGTVAEGDGLKAIVSYKADTNWTVRNDSIERSYPSEAVYTADDWTKFTYTFKLYEGSSMKIRVYLYSKASSVLIDNMSLVATDAPVARLKTDRIFYYSDYEKDGKAEITLSPYFADTAKTIEIKFKDRVKTYDTVKDAEFTNGKYEYSFPMSLFAVKEKEYTILVTIYDAAGKALGSISEKVYKIDRPTCISKDLVYRDINGKVVNPTFIYTIPKEDWATAISAGINIIQYVAPSGATTEDILAELDELYALGGYAAIVTYTGMLPAGNSTYYTRNQNYVNSIKHHPAIFCYMVMDEPFLNNPEAHEDLRKSYIMLRTADPARPTFICEGFSAYMPEIVKYCDIMAPDIYPGRTLSMANHVADMMKYARECAPERYMMTILQAFYYTGKSPSATELRSMMYQSFMGGANGLGYYLWTPLRPEYGDKYLDEGPWWQMLNDYYKNEYETVNKYYHTGENKRFYKSIEGEDFWFDSWWDGGNIYMLVQNRDVNNSASTFVPLVSDDGKTVITNYDLEVISEGDMTAVSNKKAGGFDVSLAPSQALLFKVTPFREGLKLVDKNGAELTKIAADANASFTVSTIRDGDKDAKLYLAHYKESNGLMRLYHIEVGTLNSENTGISKTISGIDTTVGKHTVKAFLWSNGEIIDTVEITEEE